MAANDDLLSAIIRHQVNILRFSKGEAEAVVAILDQAEKDLTKRIAARMSAGLSSLETSRLEAILIDVRKQRQKAVQRVKDLLKKDLNGLAFAEVEFETDAIQAALEFDINTASVPDAKLAALANSPIRGVELDGWLDNMATADVDRLQGLINMAVIEGQTPQQLTAALATAFATTRRNAEAIARTAVNHVSNKAREAVWEANSDIIDGLRWTATLDGRTSPICQSRDGEIVPFGENEFPGEELLNPPGARPPAHFNCRSVMVPIIDGETAIGDRPFVRSRKRPEQRLADFRASAMAKAGPKWKTMTAAQRRAAIAVERKAWAAKNIGRVPAKMTYEQWLRKQPRQFQDEVLGREKGKLFRQGMSLDKFVDKSGKTLGVQALKAESKQQVLALAQPGIGIKAKSLLQQGKSNQAVLNAILKEFPEANTTLASIASYKSQLKKAGQLNNSHVAGMHGTVGSGPGAIAHVISDFMENIPEGVAAQMGNTWYQIVDDLSNGHYAHYKPGLGVQISAKKFAGIPAAQAEQILAHELGHMLHKMFPEALDTWVEAGILNKGKFILKKKDLSPDGLKNYSYYLSKYDETVAEVYAQALLPSPITSQGILAQEFKVVYGDVIDAAKANLAKKFPPKKPTSTGAPIPGSGLTVGDPQNLGVTGYIKELLKQNMNADDILVAVKAEFPNAKTTKASIASTKSVMKKKGELGSPASKVTINATKTQPAVEPVIKDVKPKIVTAQDMANDLGILDSSGQVKGYIAVSVTQQKKYAKKILLNMLKAGKTGPNSDLAAQIKAIFPKAGMKATNVASFKTNWKKKGLWGDEGLEAIGMVQPKLKVSQLGAHSKKGVIKAEKMFAEGATHQQVIEMLDGHFAPFDPSKGADLLYLAEYNAKTKKFTGHAGATAVSKAHKPTPTSVKPSPKAATDMTPSRPAVSPQDAWPPPPRFSEAQRVAGLNNILSDWKYSYQKSKMTTLNARLRKEGIEELTETEFATINMYTGGSYRTINTKMRSGQFNDNLYLQALVDAGQSGLRKLQASSFRHQGLSSRGTTLSPEHYAMFQKVYVKGAVVEEFGFLSSTKGPVPAFGGRIKFMIQSKTGIFVRTFSKHPGEDEVLFMPGAKFRIDKVEVNEEQRRTVVHMTEIHP